MTHPSGPTPDFRAIPWSAPGLDAASWMESPTVAHELPALYREILDRIAALEKAGHRREADLVRVDAVRVYSSAWDGASRRRLELLRTRAERVLHGTERARPGRSRSGMWRLVRPGSPAF